MCNGRYLAEYKNTKQYSDQWAISPLIFATVSESWNTVPDMDGDLIYCAAYCLQIEVEAFETEGVCQV